MARKLTLSAAWTIVCAAHFLGCGAPASQQRSDETETRGTARLELTAVGSSTHSVYRLGPATFTISGFSDVAGDIAPLSISADGSEELLNVPLDPGNYAANLDPGWVLKQSFDSSPFTAVDATLTSPNPSKFRVEFLHTTSVEFNFSLGVSGAKIGIGVDEGDHAPPGYDGIIQPTGDGRFGVVFETGGGSCCFSTVAEAQAAFPDKKLFVSATAH